MSDLPTRTDLISAARKEGDAVVLAISGDIDLQNSPELRTELLDLLQKQKPMRFVLNLAKVQYMDSSAIAVLVEALQKLRKAGGKIHLTHLQPRVKGLLEIARLDSIFVVSATDEEALQK